MGVVGAPTSGGHTCKGGPRCESYRDVDAVQRHPDASPKRKGSAELMIEVPHVLLLMLAQLHVCIVQQDA